MMKAIISNDIKVTATPEILKYYKDNLLNYDSVVQKFGDKIDRTDLFFARPCEDTKTFTGQMFSRDSWKEFVSYHLTNGHTTTLNENTECHSLF